LLNMTSLDTVLNHALRKFLGLKKYILAI